MRHCYTTTDLMVLFFRWHALGQRMAQLDRAGELYSGHKIFRIYLKARDRFVETRQGVT